MIIVLPFRAESPSLGMMLRTLIVEFVPIDDKIHQN